jgi:hypothetical protein
MDKLLQLDVRADDPVNSHKSVSRITLRQILLSGLEDVVHFGKTFTRYFVRDDGKIVAEFTDGSYASATSWLARTADRRGCAISFYRMPKGSTPEWSA